MLRRVAFALASLAVVAPPAAAQTVVGTVRSARDSSPLFGAIVGVVDGSFVKTDSSGRFRFGKVKAGKRELRIRRLGFEPFARYVDAAGDKPNEVDIWMTPLPLRLKEVAVSGKRISVPYRFEEVYRRAASGFGHLITLEDIERRQPFYVREILNGIPGISIDNYKVRFRRCGDGTPLSSVNMRTRASSLDPTKVQVYIDGRRVTKFQTDGGTDVDEALSLVNVKDIQAIEVYVGVAELPAEFAIDACAAIAVWTKRY